MINLSALLSTVLPLTISLAIALPVCSESMEKDCNFSYSLLLANKDLILDQNCEHEKFVKTKLCHHQIGRVYSKFPLPQEIRFIQLEDKTTFWTIRGKGDVGEYVIVKDNRDVTEIIKPKWFDKLSKIDADNLSITSLITNYLEKTQKQKSVMEFCL